KVAVVTGGASGIGRALCHRFAAEGASVVVSDVDAPGASVVAQEVGGLAVPGDMAVESDVTGLVDAARLSYDRIDLFCAEHLMEHLILRKQNQSDFLTRTLRHPNAS